ncbi:MAG: thiamine diphosphokinase [Clostridia bacterium]|nr:thiamine diphosphokinase [Clostridia bacterium]
MKSNGLIVAGGSITDTEKLIEYIKKTDFLVCADKGYEIINKLCIVPNAVIGDFDSTKLVPSCEGEIEIIRYNVEKDQTDTQLCIDYLSGKEVSTVYLFGGLGGNRIDHSVANIQLMEYALSKNIQLVIIDGKTTLYLLNEGSMKIFGNIGDTLSVFAIEDVKGLTYKGLKYSLDNGDLYKYNPYCVSNSFINDTAEISIKKGLALIIHIGGETV